MKQIIMLLFLFVLGCQPATNDVLPGAAGPGDDHFVSAQKALQIARTATEQSPNARQTGDARPKKVKNQITVDDADDKSKKTVSQPVFYICNYEEGGYSIISADDRLPAVLAVVENGVGIEKNAELPGGLILWMKSTKEQIQNIRKSKLTKKAKAGGRVAASVIDQVNPLLTTKWGQFCGFNANIPGYCAEPFRCGRPLTGCVAVAMSQVVKYWGSKTPGFTTLFNYDWSAKPTGTASSSETARLMFDTGREVGTNWGCGSSGADGDNIAGILKRKFGFVAANYYTYKPVDVANNLKVGWPVIMTGCTGSGSFLWWTWGTGSCHAWVCDGYKLISTTGNEYCYYDEYGYYYCETPTVNYYQLSMNWGWDGQHDGWFTETYFGADVNNSPMPHNFNSVLKEIVDIRR